MRLRVRPLLILLLVNHLVLLPLMYAAAATAAAAPAATPAAVADAERGRLKLAAADPRDLFDEPSAEGVVTLPEMPRAPPEVSAAIPAVLPPKGSGEQWRAVES